MIDNGNRREAKKAEENSILRRNIEDAIKSTLDPLSAKRALETLNPVLNDLSHVGRRHRERDRDRDRDRPRDRQHPSLQQTRVREQDYHLKRRSDRLNLPSIQAILSDYRKVSPSNLPSVPHVRSMSEPTPSPIQIVDMFAKYPDNQNSNNNINNDNSNRHHFDSSKTVDPSLFLSSFPSSSSYPSPHPSSYPSSSSVSASLSVPTTVSASMSHIKTSTTLLSATADSYNHKPSKTKEPSYNADAVLSLMRLERINRRPDFSGFWDWKMNNENASANSEVGDNSNKKMKNNASREDIERDIKLFLGTNKNEDNCENDDGKKQIKETKIERVKRMKQAYSAQIENHTQYPDIINSENMLLPLNGHPGPGSGVNQIGHQHQHQHQHHNNYHGGVSNSNHKNDNLYNGGVNKNRIGNGTHNNGNNITDLDMQAISKYFAISDDHSFPSTPSNLNSDPSPNSNHSSHSFGARTRPVRTPERSGFSRERNTEINGNHNLLNSVNHDSDSTHRQVLNELTDKMTDKNKNNSHEPSLLTSSSSSSHTKNINMHKIKNHYSLISNPSSPIHASDSASSTLLHRNNNENNDVHEDTIISKHRDKSPLNHSENNLIDSNYLTSSESVSLDHSSVGVREISTPNISDFYHGGIDGLLDWTRTLDINV